MTEPKDHLITWLKDAHAAEEQAATMLHSLARRIESYPELQLRFEQHAAESERQAERIEACLRRHGSDASVIKDTGTKFIGFAQGVSGVFTSDEVMKGALATYTFEHMEIASYKILIAAARRVGDAETVRICEENLDVELAMARWLEDHLDGITEKFFAVEADLSAEARR